MTWAQLSTASWGRGFSNGELRLKAHIYLPEIKKTEKEYLLTSLPFPIPSFSRGICCTFPEEPFIKRILLRGWPTRLTWPSAPTRTSKHGLLGARARTVPSPDHSSHVREGHEGVGPCLLCRPQVSVSFADFHIPLMSHVCDWPLWTCPWGHHEPDSM